LSKVSRRVERWSLNIFLGKTSPQNSMGVVSKGTWFRIIKQASLSQWVVEYNLKVSIFNYQNPRSPSKQHPFNFGTTLLFQVTSILLILILDLGSESDINIIDAIKILIYFEFTYYIFKARLQIGVCKWKALKAITFIVIVFNHWKSLR